jgi:cell wall-associated NlpC family hydrolase
VLTRALVLLATAAAMAAGAVALVPTPAGASPSGPSFVAQVATGTLDHLRGWEAAQLRELLGTGRPAQAAAAEAVYKGDLQLLAQLVAPSTATPAAAFARVWTNADDRHMTAMLAALSQLGVPYHRRTQDPGVAFDCSGLTMYAWAEAGVVLGHNDRWQINASKPVTFETAHPGDLVEYPGHVMMYLGAGRAIVHAPHTGTVVQIREYGNRQARVGDPIG